MSVNKNLILPKSHLSFSSLDLWRHDKARFRRRYYENIKEPDTIYTLFGRAVHEQIDRDPSYAHIRLPVSEKKITVTVSGVPILGYIDTFDPNTFAWKEYKSGIRKPDGSPRWTQVDVEAHDQLPFYSLLLQASFGVKSNHTKLIWFETEFEENGQKVGGVVIGGERKLRLTGQYEVFSRRIYQYDRDRMRKWIRQAAEEKSSDYKRWLDK